MSYYKENAQDFIKNTIHVDMSDLYSQFESKLSSGASILDIGCGSGRDLKYFKEAGFKVMGLEPSEVLASFSKEHAGCDVQSVGINEFESTSKFDGIWACASLLHLDDNELKKAFYKIKELSHDKTIVYCSFKHGDFQGMRSGRYFNDKTIESLRPLISEFNILKDWISKDARPDRDEKWLNILLSLNN